MTKQEALKWFQFRKKMCLSDRVQEAEDIAIECIASVIAQDAAEPVSPTCSSMHSCEKCRYPLGKHDNW